jgi:hypothetical protein
MTQMRWEWRNFTARDKVRFVTISLLVFTVVSLFNPLSRASILMWFSGATTQGVISREADPSDHMYLTYAYRVGGKTYSGTGYAPYRPEMRRGQPIEVFFFPPLPGESVIANKDEQFGYSVWAIGWRLTGHICRTDRQLAAPSWSDHHTVPTWFGLINWCEIALS